MRGVDRTGGGAPPTSEARQGVSAGWAALPAGISTIVSNPIDHSAYGRATGGLRALLREIEEHGPLAG